MITTASPETISRYRAELRQLHRAWRAKEFDAAAAVELCAKMERRAIFDGIASSDFQRMEHRIGSEVARAAAKRTWRAATA